jgi:dTDP-4-dehydrorhamnose 3,5-epimerase
LPVPVEIQSTEIEGVLEIRPKIFSDMRGFFTETYNRETWVAKGFVEEFVQDNLSLSAKGTLRGMHYQIEPRAMGKLVRAVRGAVYDVAVDLRRGSPTFGKWIGRELSAENHLMLWVPVGFAHGFVALEDDTLVYYKCTGTHSPEHERSVSYKDPAIGIEWPMEPTLITDKDAQAPLLRDADFNFGQQG